MKALNFEGQCLINDSKMTQDISRKLSIKEIERGIIALKTNKIGVAKEHVRKACEYMNEACNHSIITINGSTMLVINELSDCQNRNRLTEIVNGLRVVFSELHKLCHEDNFDKNIISYPNFQLCKILSLYLKA